MLGNNNADKTTESVSGGDFPIQESVYQVLQRKQSLGNPHNDSVEGTGSLASEDLCKGSLVCDKPKIALAHCDYEQMNILGFAQKSHSQKVQPQVEPILEPQGEGAHSGGSQIKNPLKKMPSEKIQDENMQILGEYPQKESLKYFRKESESTANSCEAGAKSTHFSKSSAEESKDSSNSNAFSEKEEGRNLFNDRIMHLYQNFDELSDTNSNMFVLNPSEIGHLGGVDSCSQFDSKSNSELNLKFIEQSCQKYVEEGSQSIKLSSKDPEECISLPSVGEAPKGDKFLDIIL